jgi:hypothetical protein
VRTPTAIGLSARLLCLRARLLRLLTRLPARLLTRPRRSMGTARAPLAPRVHVVTAYACTRFLRLLMKHLQHEALAAT